MKKGIGKRILTILMAVVLVLTSGMLDGIQIQAADDSIFTGTGITLDSTELKASWPNGTGGSTSIDLSVGSEAEFPYNATIDMRLNFTIPVGTGLVAGQEYIYHVPGNIRVDEEVTHDLMDPDGVTSIGTVHISKDGTLTFKFNDNARNSAGTIPFYVRFSGGLSSDLQEENKQSTIQFPTSTGSIDYEIKTDPKAYGKAQDMSKSGTVVTVDGKKYIEWRVNIEPDSSGVVSGEIVDNLPTGLKYANVAGYPKFVDIISGQGETLRANCADGASQVSIDVSGAKTYYRVGVLFLTSYDGFTGTIQNGSTISYDNTAAFNPEDGTGVTASNRVTIRPNMLQKSGSTIDADGYITWTVKLNEDQLDLNGAVLEDQVTAGSGMEIVPGSFTVNPALPATATQDITTDHVKIAFGTADTNTYTITYKTKVTDYGKSSYSNSATLKDPTLSKYDLSKTATVSGIKVIRKVPGEYNSVTNTFTWKIIVNEDGKSCTNVVVKDWFSSDRMEFVSATLDDGSVPTFTKGTRTDTVDGVAGKPCTELTFNLGKQTTRREITIVTKLNEAFRSEAETADKKYENHCSFQCDEYPEMKADAYKWQKVTKPQLMNKQGSFDENTGRYTWTINFNKQSIPLTKLSFEDLIPEGMEYVANSMQFYAWEGAYQWQRFDLSPTQDTVNDSGVNKEKLSYTFDSGKTGEDELFTGIGFSIVYSTKISDVTKINDGLTYENKATMNATFHAETDVDVSDTKTASVTGRPGGVIGKSGAYTQSNDYVTWTVDINKGHYDMSAISNPAITDQLADYLKYLSGTLYLIDDTYNSSDPRYKTEVSSSDYTVVIVNNKMTVILPKNIGKNYYQFVFKTQFTRTAAELSGVTITNKANFEGSGETFEKTSNEIKNVSFSSSSAGTIINRELRIKKVDSATKAPLAGAEFELYLKGVLVGSAVSGADGLATFENIDTLIGYELKLKETKAPSGYLAPAGDTTIPAFTAEEMTSEGERIKYYQISVENVSEKTATTGDINLVKKNADKTLLLAGAEFGLYPGTDSTCDGTPLETQTSGADGTISFKNREKGTYYIKEIDAPEGYLLGSAVIKVELKDNGAGVVKAYYNDETASVDLFEISNTEATGSLELTKVDSTNATLYLSGAEYELYDDAICTNRIATAVTGAPTGKAVFTGLKLGKKYYYREVKAPVGYVLDSTIHDVTIGTGTEKSNQTETVTLTNKKAVANIVITKTDDGTTPAKLAGVVFRLYKEDGVTPYQKVTGTDYTVTTNSEGIASFTDIPFGKYVVKEITGKSGYALAVDTAITLDTLGNERITIVNKEIKCRIKISKKVGSTGASLAGARFSLINSVGSVVATGVTNASGELFFEDVAYGNYTLREISAPDGYSKAADTTITAAEIETMYNTAAAAGSDGSTGIVEKTVVDQKQNGSIKLTKYQQDGITALAGAVFTLYDFNKIAVATKTTDTSGEITFNGLKYGTYYVKEVTAPTDYILDTTEYKVVVDSDTVVTKYVDAAGNFQNLDLTNQKVNNPIISIKLKKVSLDDTTKPVANAIFGIFRNDETTPIAQAVSDENGLVVFSRIDISDVGDPGNVTLTNKFFIKEISAPTGYKVSTKKYPLGTYEEIKNHDGGCYLDNESTAKENTNIAWYQNETNAIVTNVEIKGSIEITKRSSTTNALLEGAQFELLDSAKNSFTPKKIATTDANGKASFSNLPVGYYYIREIVAPTGFTVNATDVNVSILNDTPVQKTIKDDPIELKVSKKAGTSATELSGATLEIYEKAAGTTGALIQRFTTDGSVVNIPNNLLKAGTTYVLREKEAPAGYAYAAEIEFTINTDGSITTAAEKNGQTVIMRDQPVYTTITKVDDSSPAVAVINATLAVYDESNTEVLRFVTGSSPYTTAVGVLKAPKSGYNTYTVKEIITPAGYETAPPFTFCVSSDGKICDDTVSHVEIAGITMVDPKKTNTRFYIRKLDDATDLDLAGAHMAITASDGTTVLTEWVTDGTTHAVNIDGTKFKKDGTTEYILKETKAPGGYTLAAGVRFVINTGGKLELKSGNSTNLNGDEDTLLVRDKSFAVKIRKVDSFGSLLAGATLALSEYDMTSHAVGTTLKEFTTTTSEYQFDSALLRADDTDIQWYILQETGVPEGYMKAEDIIFRINGNGLMQKADGSLIAGNVIEMEDKEAGICVGKVDAQTNEPVAGANLSITSGDDATFVPITWTSDTTLKSFDLSKFKFGNIYTLTETGAPDGYSYTEPVDFTIDAATHEVIVNSEAVHNRTIYLKDQKISLSVSKLNKNTNEAVVGAELSIVDETGTELASWTSTAEAYAIDTYRFTVPDSGYKEYTLHEKKAPSGYRTAADIPFALDREGKLYAVTESGGVKSYIQITDGLLKMYDEPLLTVAKMDTAGQMISDAVLKISAKDDPGFEAISITTGPKPYVIADGVLHEGVTYVLSEEKAPNGYLYARDITFTINADGKLVADGTVVDNMRLVMLDAPLTIKSNKTDSNGKTLAGAKMEVKDAFGNVIYSYTTTEEILTLPKEIFAAPKTDGMAYYTLSEKEAPQGYELARDISFGIDKDGKLYVKNENGGYLMVEDGVLVMVDALSAILTTTNTTTITTTTVKNHNTKIPKTGDGTPLGTLLLIFWVMIAGMVMSFIKYFRQKRRRNMRLKKKQCNRTL